MRGKGNEIVAYVVTDRITPAYAGKSRRYRLPAMWSWDHPRLCGEKFLIARNRPHQSGSPPPMRGKAILLLFCKFNPRITPAYAGKRVQAVRYSRAAEDHPRLCGEKC